MHFILSFSNFFPDFNQVPFLLGIWGVKQPNSFLPQLSPTNPPPGPNTYNPTGHPSQGPQGFLHLRLPRPIPLHKAPQPYPLTGHQSIPLHSTKPSRYPQSPPLPHKHRELTALQFKRGNASNLLKLIEQYSNHKEDYGHSLSRQKLLSGMKQKYVRKKNFAKNNLYFDIYQHFKIKLLAIL